MRLLQFPYSPFAAKLRVCLKLKGVACEIVDVPYLDRREVVALTGGVSVPVLVDGDTVLTDSPRIAAWLDERFPPSLRGGPFGSLAVVIEQWAEGTLEEVAFRFACPGLERQIVAANGGRTDAGAMFRLVKERKYGSGCIELWRRDEAHLEAQLLVLLEPIAEALKTRRFLLGDAAMIADAAVYGQLQMVEYARPGWVAAKAPGLAAWFQALRA